MINFIFDPKQRNVLPKQTSIYGQAKHNHSPRQPARCEPPWYMDLCTFFIAHPCTYISEERSCIYPTKPFQFSHRTACQHSPLLNSQPSTALPNPHITYSFYPLASLLSSHHPIHSVNQSSCWHIADLLSVSSLETDRCP